MEFLIDGACVGAGYMLAIGMARVRNRHRRKRCDANTNPGCLTHCPNFSAPGCETYNCPQHCVMYCRCGAGVEP